MCRRAFLPGDLGGYWAFRQCGQRANLPRPKEAQVTPRREPAHTGPFETQGAWAGRLVPGAFQEEVTSPKRGPKPPTPGIYFAACAMGAARELGPGVPLRGYSGCIPSARGLWLL